ncbi:hypothetical protein WJX79_000251 [Trebouxia sp. C0005]
MSQTHEPDLTAMEGPDDWVSLILDGANDDMLNDLEMSDFSVAAPTPAANDNSQKIASVEKSGRISAPEVEQAVSSLNTEDMCLPSLDDLLADYPATVSDDGLFSGFQSLDNQGLDLLALPDESATRSHQHSNNMSGRKSEEHSYSAGSEGELSTAAAQLNSFESTPGFPSQQPQHRTPVQASNRVIPAPTTAGSMSSSPAPVTAGQGASPSLVGMTAAQVAEALGYSSRPAHVQQAQGLTSASTISKQPAEHSSGQSAAGDDEEQKRMARMQRNRESAHQSRQRKRMQMDEVEQRCEQLKQQNSQLNQLVGRLTTENMGLKQQLVNVCHETGRPLPSPPLAAMHPFAFGQMGLPMLVPAPKVPIQKMPASRPASVPSGTFSDQSSQHPANIQTSGLLDAAHVEPSKSIVLRPSNREAESQALQSLKDLAPVVLYSQWDQGFSQAKLPSGQSPWQKSLPGAAKDEASELNGFHSPSMCKEVFQFEAQETSVVQATQHVQRYLAGGTASMRGSGSIALPPVTQPSQDMPSSRSSKRHKATIGCGEDDPDVVVSVMLPTKSQGAADNEFTSLDQLYVVVLTPGVKYSTYSCLLPKPVLV